MKFSKYNIAPEIKKSLEELGFVKPTDIQYKAIPPIMKGDDLLAIAQTGTGKTAAFAIPIIDYLFKNSADTKNGFIRCLVMVPTRELAIQITEFFDLAARYTTVETLCTFGGVEQAPQIEALKNGVDILVSTPGRMFDLRAQGHINLKQTEILVLDEADHMLALGFIKDIRDVVMRMPRKYQTLFFSATINPEIKELAYSLAKNPVRIQISPKDPVSKNIEHHVAYIEMDDKRFFLERLVKENPEKKFLVFVRTKVRAERVFEAMKRVNVETITMHGDKIQADRLVVMEKFREGSVKVLIATDVSARGIDIPGVNYVVNYDLPEIAENYVHRVGRTGRGKERGKAISFCSPEEKKVLDEIQIFLGKEIHEMPIEKSEYRMTVAMTEESSAEWKTLLKQAETDTRKFSKGKKKK